MKLLFLCSPASATFLTKRKQKSYKQNTYPGSGINQGPVSQEATNYFHLPSTCCHVQRRFSTLQKSKKVSVSQTSVKKQSSDAANSARASARVETCVSAHWEPGFRANDRQLRTGCAYMSPGCGLQTRWSWTNVITLQRVRIKVLVYTIFCLIESPGHMHSSAFYTRMHQLVHHTGGTSVLSPSLSRDSEAHKPQDGRAFFFQMLSSCTLCGAGSFKSPCSGCAQLSQHTKCVKSVLSSPALSAGYRINVIPSLLQPTEFEGLYETLEG